jgi:hypothetical protein
MRKEEFEDIRNRLLLRINKLTPVMHRLIEVESTLRLVFNEFSRKDIIEESKWEGYCLSGLHTYDLINKEEKGLRKGSKIVENVEYLGDLSGLDNTLEYFANLVEDGKSLSNNARSVIHNFALDRVIETIERFPEPPPVNYDDYEWRKVKTPDGEIMIPGLTKTVLNYLTKDASAIFTLNNIGRCFWNGTLEKSQLNFSFDVELKDLQNNFQDGLEFYRYIFGKIETYVETFFPGCITFIGKRDNRYTGRIFTSDAIFLFNGYNSLKNSWFIARSLNNKKEYDLNICVYYLYRMLLNLQGKDNKSKPGFSWCREKDLQRFLPPDARYVWKVSSTKILVSRETETFIYINEEKEPFLRFIVYPFEFFGNIFSECNPLFKLKKVSVKNVC